jgi:hypothetical protein
MNDFFRTPGNFNELSEEAQSGLRQKAMAEGWTWFLQCRCRATVRELRRDWDDLSELGKSRRQGQWLVAVVLPGMFVFLAGWIASHIPGGVEKNKYATMISNAGPLCLISTSDNCTFRELTVDVSTLDQSITPGSSIGGTANGTFISPMCVA